MDVLIERISAVADATKEIHDLLLGADGARGVVGRLDVIEHRVEVVERRPPGCDCADLRADIVRLENAHRAHAAIDATVAPPPPAQARTGDHPTVAVVPPPAPVLDLWGAKLPPGFARFLVVAVLIASLFLAYSPAVNRAAEGWAAAQLARAGQPPKKETP